MKPMTLEQLYNHGKKFAALRFNADGHLAPMWIMETINGKHIPVVMSMEVMADKDRCAAAIQELLTQKQAVRYVSLLEAWMATVDKTATRQELYDELAVVPVSERPDRQEVIWVIAEDRHHKLAGYYTIIRPKIGKPRVGDYIEQHPAEKGEVEGRFVNMLGRWAVGAVMVII
jgi:hypothetical protein